MIAIIALVIISIHITTETLRNKYLIKDSMTDYDLITFSHKTANGYSSSAITLGELKKYIKGE